MKILRNKRKVNNKGITLIALVITIIVLLILAAVSIATLTGENGILTRANDAKDKTEQAKLNEENQIQDIENYIEEYVSGISNRVVQGENLFNKNDCKMDSMYAITGGKPGYSNNTNYFVSNEIHVTSGQVIYFSNFDLDNNQYENLSGPQISRFIMEFDSEKNFIRNVSEDVRSGEYTVPEGVSYIYMTFYSRYLTNKNIDGFIISTNPITCYTSYGDNIQQRNILGFMQDRIDVAVGETVSLINNNICPSVYRFGADEITFDWDCDIGTINEYGITFNPQTEDIGTHNATIKIYDGNVLTKKVSTTINVVPRGLNNTVNVLTIGDSLSNNKEWYDQILEKDSNINFVGTQFSTYSNGQTSKYHHEAYSGASADGFLNNQMVTTNFTNPFYNYSTSKFDYKYYLTNNQDIQPNVILLFLGTNGSSADPTNNGNNILEIISKIREADSNIPIYVVHTLTLGNKTYNETLLSYNLFEYLNAKLKNISNIYTIPLETTNNTNTRFDTDMTHPSDYSDFSATFYSAFCANN